MKAIKPRAIHHACPAEAPGRLLAAGKRLLTLANVASDKMAIQSTTPVKSALCL